VSLFFEIVRTPGTSTPSISKTFTLNVPIKGFMFWLLKIAQERKKESSINKKDFFISISLWLISY
jgi:hypothetical protein